MAKRAIKIQGTLQTWADVDNGLYQLGYLSGQSDKCRAEYEQKMEALRAEMADALNQIGALMDAEGQQIYLFALTRQGEMDPKRSKKLNHGTVAFKRSTVLKLTYRDVETARRLTEAGHGELVEATPKIDKVGMKKLDLETLDRMGGKLVERDNFRIELPQHVFETDGKKLRVVKL